MKLTILTHTENTSARILPMPFAAKASRWTMQWVADACGATRFIRATRPDFLPGHRSSADWAKNYQARGKFPH